MDNQLNIKKLLKPVPDKSTFKMENWCVWGASVVEHNEKYHMYFSRWPEKENFRGWVTHSEIAYAVSDDPLGPFQFQNIALGKRDGNYWDADVAHNPNIIKWENKFYLYYTGNYGNGDYWVHRDNQRIGVAVADEPMGPWKRLNQPVIDISTDSWDSLLTTNPSCCVKPDGEFLLIYKAAIDKKGTKSNKAPVYHGVAFADNPLGPFEKHPEPIFTSDEARFPGEDPYVWFQDNFFYTILKDMGNNYTKNQRALVLFKSKDGINWELASEPLVTKREVVFKNKGTKKFNKLERPQLLIKEGKPVVLYCGVKPNKDTEITYNVHIPLEE